MELDPSQILATLQQWINPKRYQDRLNLDIETILTFLLEQNIELQGLMPWSSNYTFLTSLALPASEEKLLAIYKPCDGERPLWDFPDGALCQREFASYIISEVLGWPFIPPTILRNNGPHGPGTLQLFIEADYDLHYFSLRENKSLTEDFRQIALFDHIVNNADRKGGHCLQDGAGRIWAIDHGLTFHSHYKLRTVIWEYCEVPIPAALNKDLERLYALLGQDSDLCTILAQLITSAEITAFRERIEMLLTEGHLPNLYHGRNVPFPPI